MKKLFLFGLILLCLISFVCSYQIVYSNNMIQDIIFNPNKYYRLPDNLEPYVCDNGKVDLVLASLDVKKGMNPNVKRVVLKEELNCGDD